MMKPFRVFEGWIARYLRSDRGNVAAFVALTLPLVISGAAFGVETGFHYYKGIQVQAAADSAAYAGAIELMNGSSGATVTSIATNAATSNNWQSAAGTIQVNTPPSSGPNQTSQAVEVILTENEPRFFTSLFTAQPMTVTRRAVAVYKIASNACIVALNKIASRAINVGGNSSMNLQGCDVTSNSTASDALYVGGSGALRADCALAVGGITADGGMTLSQCPGGIAGALPVSDPFSALPSPSPPGPCINNGNINGGTINPGYYCNGLSLKGTVTMNPGLYYVEGGDFKTNSNASITGSGITVYTSGTARISMNGTADIRLYAPTTGTYAGMLFYGDRNSVGGSNTFNGDALSGLTGNLYFPSQQVSYNGNFTGDNGCTYIVADTVSWSGSTTFSVDCTTQGMPKIPAQNAVSMVE
jgi:Flp pilus assembly protein TadG